MRDFALNTILTRVLFCMHRKKPDKRSEQCIPTIIRTAKTCPIRY